MTHCVRTLEQNMTHCVRTEQNITHCVTPFTLQLSDVNNILINKLL